MSFATGKEEISCPFSEHLARLMRERGLKHREIAAIAGVSKTAVGKWLKGTIPGAAELFRIAKFFGKPMESFFDGIPFVAPPVEATFVPPGEMPVNFIDPELREDYARMFEQMSTPGVSEAFRKFSKMLSSHDGMAQSASGEKAKQVLTQCSESVILPPMKSELQELLVATRDLTKSRGMKTKLAKTLAVPLPRVSEWLAGNYLPSGENALKLRDWARNQQERQQNKSSDSVSAPPEPKTQPKESNEKKPRSSPQKR